MLTAELAVLLNLVCKDLRMELRRKELLSLLLVLNISLCLIVSLGINSSFLTQQSIQDLYVPMLWVISVFTSTLALGRGFEYELENRAFDSVRLSGVSEGMIYLAKFCSNLLVMLLGQFAAIFILAIFLNVSIANSLWALLLLSILVMVGLAALGTLLSAITMGSRMKGMLLPLISLPLCTPIYLAALELGWQATEQGALHIGSIWLNLLLFLDSLYIFLGCCLFKAAIRE